MARAIYSNTARAIYTEVEGNVTAIGTKLFHSLTDAAQNVINLATKRPDQTQNSKYDLQKGNTFRSPHNIYTAFFPFGIDEPYASQPTRVEVRIDKHNRTIIATAEDLTTEDIARIFGLIV